MSSTAENDRATKRLNALDPELAFLASQAAIELDNLLLGRNGDLHSVKQLAQRFESSTEQGNQIEDRKSLMDPATVSVFNRAIVASGEISVQSLSQLALKAWEISKDLQGFQIDPDKQNVKRLRNFCTFLAQSAVAHERSLYEMQSVNNDWS